MMQNPRVTCNNRAARNIIPTDSGAGLWYDTFGQDPQSWVHAQGFLNASVEVGQFAGLGVRGLEVCCVSG